MLIHRHDAVRDEAEWRQFVTAQGFGHLVAAGAGRPVPVVVPTQYVLEESHVWLHLAAFQPAARRRRGEPAGAVERGR